MIRALVIVDVQNDFCEVGSLAIGGGAAVAARISEYVSTSGGEYDAVVATADWHIDPGDHWSSEPDFVDSWPVHCRAGSPGAAFHDAVRPATDRAQAVFRKGEYVAAYSGFEGDADGERLADWLRERRIDAVDVVGLATDHCVRATALDAAREGLDTRVLMSLCAGVDDDAVAAALTALRDAGVEIA